MSENWKEIWLSAVLGLVLPALVMTMAVRFGKRNPLPQELMITEAPSETAAPAAPVTVEVLGKDGKVSTVDLEEYLIGVVLAEMPASFEAEARKAQAVVARTFTLRSRDRSKHDNADICMDSGCCQAYMSPEEYLSRGGTEEGVQRMAEAVAATAGKVLTYEGELIEATYFSCSGGSTEDAVAVWGTDVPYLQSVESPGEENAAHYTDTVTFTPEAFAAALGLKLTGKPASWIGSVTYTAGGGVDTMVIGGSSFRGTELRKALGLRSTAFTVTAGEEEIVITTRGYGHRVGMSQYGAEAMAVSGSSYAEILTHYYQGAVLTQMF